MWKLFGNKQDEQAIRCLGLCWFEQCIVAAIQEEGGAYSIQIFPRKHLSGDSVLGSFDLQKKPIFIDCTGSYVIIIKEDGSFTQLHLMPMIEDNVITSIEITKIKQLFLTDSPESIISLSVFRSEQMTFYQRRKYPTSPTLSPTTTTTTATASSASPPLTPQKPSEIQQQLPQNTPRTIAAAAVAAALKLVLLEDTGDLCIVDTLSGTTTKVDSGIERFWITMPSTPLLRTSSQIDSVLWTYGKKGLQFWQGFTGDITAESRPPLNLVEGTNSVEDEVYPVGIMPLFGVVIGLFQASSLLNLPASSTTIPPPPPMPSIPQFHIQIKSHPFIQRVLRQALIEKDRSCIESIVQSIRNSPAFSIILELLLFESFEASKKVLGQPDIELEEVIHFIRFFPEFPLVVVNCARKTESTSWQYLFSMAGDPLSLFDGCLKTRMLAGAASYLYIILELKGEENAINCSTKLLEFALEIYDYNQAADIIRFTRNICHGNAHAPIESLLNKHFDRLSASSDRYHLNSFQKLLSK